MVDFSKPRDPNYYDSLDVEKKKKAVKTSTKTVLDSTKEPTKQLSTWIKVSIFRQMKLFCAQNEITIQDFIENSIKQTLDKTNNSPQPAQQEKN